MADVTMFEALQQDNGELLSEVLASLPESHRKALVNRKNADFVTPVIEAADTEKRNALR